MRDRDYQDDFYSYRKKSVHQRMSRPQPNIWQKLSRVVEIVIYILVILIVAKFFSPEMQRAKALENELGRLEQIRDEKREQVDRLKREHENLSSDPGYLEAVARDRLNLQKPGEYVIQFKR